MSNYNHKFSFIKSYKLPKVISLIKTCNKEDRDICLNEFQSDEWDLSPDIIKKADVYELWHKVKIF